MATTETTEAPKPTQAELNALYTLATVNREWPGTVRNYMGKERPDAIDLIRVRTPQGDIYVVEYVMTVDKDDTFTDIFDVTLCETSPIVLG